MLMMLEANNMRWEILETQTQLFDECHLENAEFLIRECQTIKEGDQRVVYHNEANGFCIKCMQPRKARKEWRNWKGLYEHGLPSITPVAIGISRDRGYLISLAHHDYAQLNKAFDTLGYKGRLQLLKGLGEVVRKMHGAGFYHGDLHGADFMVRFHERGADLKIASFQKGGFKRITKRRTLRNLADLALSHFFCLGIRERLAFLRGYCGNSQGARAFIRYQGRQLERLILKRSSLVADHKARKFRKINKYFNRLILENSLYRGVYVRKNRELIPESFLSSPLEFIYGNETSVLKNSRPVRVVRFKDVCIKYYKRRGPKDLLKSWLGVSKGKRSFQGALAMVYRFIATPEPVCYLEGRAGDSFYLSRFVDGSRNLGVYLREVSQGKRKECMRALAPFLNRMFYRGVYHLDLKGSNIMVRNVGPTFRFYLIDTDEMAFSWKGIHRPLYKSLLRITRTLAPYFGREELIEFAAGCLCNLPVLPPSVSPDDVVDKAFRIESIRQS